MVFKCTAWTVEVNEEESLSLLDKKQMAVFWRPWRFYLSLQLLTVVNVRHSCSRPDQHRKESDGRLS